MSDVGRAVAFAARLYRQRTAVACSGYVRRDPMALLNLRQGRADPYPIYERIRASGTLVPTRLGNWMSTSHRVCDLVLRNRRFGVRLDDGGEAAGPGDFDMSFLEMNPPDHTRLRRLAQPAFSPKAVTGYRDRIERTVGDLLDRAATKGEFDLVSALAAPLPIAVITDLLGIPDADADAFAQYGAVMCRPADAGGQGGRGDAAVRSAGPGHRAGGAGAAGAGGQGGPPRPVRGDVDRGREPRP